MSKRRVKLTLKEYNELAESRAWAERRGLTGLAEFYRETLSFLAKRRALPESAPEAKAAAVEEELRQ